MSQFLANHAMENFFINPTMTQDTSMETFARISVMEDISPKTRLDEFPLSDDQMNDKVRPVSTIQDLFLSHNFATSYQSEEELGSPRESSDDNISLQSYDADLESPLTELDQPEPSAVDLFLMPEELANSCTKMGKRVKEAQVVTLKPVGKPIMVSMPKLVDHTQGHHRRISIESYRSGIAASVRRQESRRSIKSRTSMETAEPVPALPPLLSPLHLEEAPADAVTVSEAPTQTPARQASVPLMRAVTAFDPFPKLSDIAAQRDMPPRPSRKAIMMRRSMTAPEVPEWSTDGRAMATARRGLHRITSSISTASEVVRRKTSMSSLLMGSSPTSPTRHASLMFDKNGPKTPMGPVPTRHSSIGTVGKLTPRGPTERAPILILPAFPDDEEDDDFGDASSDPAPPKWDRPQARQAAKLRKARPSIDGVVAHGMF